MTREMREKWTVWSDGVLMDDKEFTEDDPRYAIAMAAFYGGYAARDTDVYVNMTDPATGKWLAVADSFDGGEHWAWGYLHGIGATVNDEHRVLVHAKSTGAYSIVIAGGILESGEDWEGACLERDLDAAVQAAKAASKALDAHTAARKAEEKKAPDECLDCPAGPRDADDHDVTKHDPAIYPVVGVQPYVRMPPLPHPDRYPMKRKTEE